MSDAILCPQCGAPLPGRTLGGLCRRCVGRRLLAATDGPATPVENENEGEGGRLGNFLLGSKLGEGGCGVVYAAEQLEPVRRPVALKIIKLGMDTRSVVARFEAERQALAIMDHPNIARVFDAGATASGRPYFVMELVPGVRITEFCDRHALGLSARLELFIKVCQAVQHAHQKGVIHRDLKPSNILVTMVEGAPVPKVIDFGIAKATGARLADVTLVTEVHQFLGTPAYMSPEQVDPGGRDIDTRSDIYSLGVVLYELLTGRAPFDAREMAAGGPELVRRTIREIEPPRPSTRCGMLSATELAAVADRRSVAADGLRPELRGDLDWIVMRCLEKDRARRFETANALAQDLRRHLADEPVTAGAPGTGYRFRKFARRNRVALAVICLIGLILVAATTITAWLAIRASSAEARATRQLAESEKARAESDALARFLTEVFQSPDPKKDGRLLTVAESLDRAVRKLVTEMADRPERQARLAATVGDTYHSLGLFPEAIAVKTRVRDGRLAAAGAEHPDTLDATHSLALSLMAAERRGEALALLEQVVASRRRLQGADAPATLLAECHLAWSWHQNKRVPDAIQLMERVLPESRRVNGSEHPTTVTAMSYLGWFNGVAKRWNEALRWQTNALAFMLRQGGPEHPDVLNAKTALCTTYRGLGRLDEALQLQREMVELSRVVKGERHAETIWARGNLADILTTAGRLAEALEAYRGIYTLSREVNGLGHHRTIWALRKWVECADQLNRPGEALAAEELVVSAMALLGDRDTDAIQAARFRRAVRLLDAGRPAEAESALGVCTSAGRTNELTNSVFLDRCLRTLVEARLLQGRFDAADEAVAERARLHAEWPKDARQADGFDAEAEAGRLQVIRAWSERRTNAAVAVERARAGSRRLELAVGRGVGSSAALRGALAEAMMVLAVSDGTLTPARREEQMAAAERMMLASQADLASKRSSVVLEREGERRLMRLYEAWEKPARLDEWRASQARSAWVWDNR